MQSKWFKEKDKATILRKRGNSLGFIANKFKIPKSTLSGWFKGLEISESGKLRIYKNWRLRLVSTRKGAVKWHNTQKTNRLKDAKEKAMASLVNLKSADIHLIELALAMLYLGEGGKKEGGTLIGNADPLILRFFIVVLVNVYGVPIEKIKADLHLRADQNAVQLKRYWSKTLGLPIKNFIGTFFDKRTEGRPTYPGYKGVCLIRCGHSQIQRKLISMSRLYCEKIIKNCEGA